MAAINRLKKESEDILKNPPGNCNACPNNDNIYNWSAQIYGPTDTAYEGGVFRLNIIYPKNYPFKPPKINFTTKVYHPNIDTSGNICLDILKDKWSPALTISKILLSICSLLNEPNPKDPLMPDIAKEFTDNRSLYEANAKTWTQIYAK
jgi:ubiquitin-conjugating enzyme E2 D/E|tara:strand:- start:1365 stop:1811 length:447 start_codon:yes stop_codon:yes gene_type:complete